MAEQSFTINPKDEDDVLCDEFLEKLQDCVSNYFVGYKDGYIDKYVSALERGSIPKVWIKKAIIEGLKNA